jgi:predicted ABC-type ATPase
LSAIDRLEVAKSIGFEFWFLYVVLDDPNWNRERVRLRVLKGGHAVPEDKIVERFWRSLEQMPWFLAQPDRAFLYDNSGDQRIPPAWTAYRDCPV